MDPMALARAIHFAAVMLPAGAWTFMVLVASPAVARDMRRQLDVLTWTGLSVGLASGLAWLLLQASSMIGSPPQAILADGSAITVVTRTRFGLVWECRGALAVALAVFLLLRPGRRWVDMAILALGASLLASLAWSGHAAANGDPLHLGADAIHLLAAGGWLGSLPPLLLALGRPFGQEATIVLVRRYSTLGLCCVAALLATGVVNSLLLVGTLPALIGTPYGRVLLAKVLLFAAMVAIAAFNRLALAPALGGAEAPRAARRLRRNALGECLLGIAVLAFAGMLGTIPPGVHEQPWWPFPAKISLEAVKALPDLRSEALAWLSIALFGLGLTCAGLFRRKGRSWFIPPGLALGVLGAWNLLPLVSAEAYPTTFYSQPKPFTTASLRRGESVYRANCTSCHGAEGRGDGPAAKGLRVPPADLTAEHLFDHSDGDLFWWIGEGMDDGLMPGFASTIPESDRWDLINFLHARAGAVLASDLSAKITAFPAPSAPDFSFEADGRETTLLIEAAKGGLLVDFSDEGIAIKRLGATALMLAPNPEIRAAYRLFEAPIQGKLTGREANIAFLVDRAGLVRARWRPGDQPDWRDPTALDQQIKRMEAMPLHPRASSGHRH